MRPLPGRREPMAICFVDALARFKDKNAPLCDRCKMLNSLTTEDRLAIAVRRLSTASRPNAEAEEREWAAQMEKWAEQKRATGVKTPRDPKRDRESSPRLRRHGAKSSKRASSTGRI